MFDHRAHVEAGFHAIQSEGLLVALTTFPAFLKELVADEPERYHATITWAYLLLIAERMHADDTFATFARRHPELFDPTLLPTLYGDDLRSAEARRAFVPPAQRSTARGSSSP